MVCEKAPPASEIEWKQPWGERRRGIWIRGGVGLKPGCRALGRTVERRVADGIAAGVDARGVEGRIGDAKSEVLQQPRLLQIDAVLHVVAPLGGRNVGLHAPVQELPVLTLRGGRIGEQIPAGVVIHLILPSVRVDCKQGMGAEGVLIPWSDVPGKYPLMLVLRQLIAIIGNLKPTARGK